MLNPDNAVMTIQVAPIAMKQVVIFGVVDILVALGLLVVVFWLVRLLLAKTSDGEYKYIPPEDDEGMARAGAWCTALLLFAWLTWLMIHGVMYIINPTYWVFTNV